MKIAAIHMGNDLFRRYMMGKYASAIKNAGADIVWIDSTNNLLSYDGLLLPGGADVNPELYGEPASAECGKPNAFRDGFEMEVIPIWLKTEKPLLAICRGVQILNVALGGKLYQDIKTIESVKHSNVLKKNNGCHDVIIEKGSLLHEIEGKDKLWVNSLHHQAVKTLGDGLVVSATSTDGFIEAIEITDHPFALGVQWHPEHMQKHLDQRKIFNAFVKAATQIKASCS